MTFQDSFKKALEKIEFELSVLRQRKIEDLLKDLQTTLDKHTK